MSSCVKNYCWWRDCHVLRIHLEGTFFHVSHFSSFISSEWKLFGMWSVFCWARTRKNDKFLMEGWRCSTNQNSLCLATFSYCQNSSLEKGSVRESVSQVFNSPSGLDIFHQFLPFCFDGSPVLLCYPSPWSLWLALALTCLVSRLMSASLFCFSLSSLISQYILVTSVAFQDT